MTYRQGWARRAIFAAMTLTVACAAPAIAQETEAHAAPATLADEFANASASLIARLGSVESGRPAVGMADDAIRAHFDAIERTMDQFDTPAFPVDGLNSFDGVCGPLNQINVRYALDGLVAYRDGGGTAEGPAMVQFMSRNATRFQDEVILLTARLIQCQSAHIPALTSFFDALPTEQRTATRLSGLRQMRGGHARMITGVIITAHDPAIRPENRLRALRSLQLHIGPMVQAMPLADRAALLNSLMPMLGRGDAVSAEGRQAVMTALQDTGCTGLCLTP